MGQSWRDVFCSRRSRTKVLLSRSSRTDRHTHPTISTLYNDVHWKMRLVHHLPQQPECALFPLLDPKTHKRPNGNKHTQVQKKASKIWPTLYPIRAGTSSTCPERKGLFECRRVAISTGAKPKRTTGACQLSFQACSSHDCYVIPTIQLHFVDLHSNMLKLTSTFNTPI